MCEIEHGLVAVLLGIIADRDLRTKQISCLSLVLMAVLVLVLRMIFVEDSMWSTLGGVAVGISFFFISKYSRESVGYGDSWLILLLGIFLGGKMIMELVFVASFLAALYSIGYGFIRGWNRKNTIPFIPFLTLAYLGVVLL